MSSNNIFNKYVVPTRPLLVLALLLGAYIFVFRPTAAPEENIAPAPINNGGQAVSGGEGGDVAEIDLDAALPTESLIASLFGSDSVDPFFSLPEIAPVIDPTLQENIYTAPEEEPARSIYYYLVDASNVGFEANPSRLGLALATAEQGEVEALNNLIKDSEIRLVRYAAILPPAELETIHSESLSLLEKYIAHMRNSRDRVDGTVEATWNNSERDVIAEDAARITGQIREIVHNYDILLPSGVLP